MVDVALQQDYIAQERSNTIALSRLVFIILCHRLGGRKAGWTARPREACLRWLLE